ncbi:LamG domain-containing protein [Candidatus Poribacteria bacterium]|nr:LamG domain-containing protein [Candidatus Poribacteria bacterium]
MIYRILLSLLILAGLVLMPFSATALDLKDKELLLYLPFNEGKGKAAEDLSPHGNDGELNGDAGWTDGKFGKAMEFTEKGEVKSPYIELNEKSFTVTMWVKPALSGGDQQCVFTQTQVNAQNTSLHYRIYNSGTVRMGFYGNDLDAPAAVKADKWAHITFWLDVKGKSRQIYIDGKSVAEDAGKAGIEYLGTAGDTIVGSWGNTGQRFNGVIDEVTVWDRALSEDDIARSMEDLTALPVDPADKLATTWASVKAWR